MHRPKRHQLMDQLTSEGEMRKTSNNHDDFRRISAERPVIKKLEDNLSIHHLDKFSAHARNDYGCHQNYVKPIRNKMVDTLKFTGEMQKGSFQFQSCFNFSFIFPLDISFPLSFFFYLEFLGIFHAQLLHISLVILATWIFEALSRIISIPRNNKCYLIAIVSRNRWGFWEAASDYFNLPASSNDVWKNFFDYFKIHWDSLKSFFRGS